MHAFHEAQGEVLHSLRAELSVPTHMGAKIASQLTRPNGDTYMTRDVVYANHNTVGKLTQWVLYAGAPWARVEVWQQMRYDLSLRTGVYRMAINHVTWIPAHKVISAATWRPHKDGVHCTAIFVV